ncbi:hypothetical protein Nepgr_027698 [Nepenthes gracilis]|uniref:BSD domain-containing protein n=1 Tax=Nepenthes gracilis TaxID=150966 RepID=A0AAD3TAA4_NEPGR|nr:hypothetical protein Nepgr_027698 [Nepenthes gracilis]
MYSWLRRNLQRNSGSSNKAQEPRTPVSKDQEEEVYGVTDQLIEFVRSFTVDTFKNFSLPEDQSDETQTTSGGIQIDLSDWQQRHATIILSKVKEVSQMRYQLCPRQLKERQFWRIYFTLVRSFVSEYELQAVRLEKLRKMAMEDKKSSDTNAVELEMSEAKHSSSSAPSP